MHAYLIAGADREKVTHQTGKLAKELGAKLMPFALAKIEDVRSLEKFTNLAVTEPTAVVIEDIDAATPEALNAFLKNLEEPQGGLYYILTAESTRNILPTIVSRCQIIKIKNEILKSKNDDAEKFLNMSLGSRLLFIDKIRDREEAKAFVFGLLNLSHALLHTGPETSSGHLLEIAENIEVEARAFRGLKANGNVGLQLTMLAVNLG